MNQQVTEKQHFVPKFYLRRFAEGNGLLTPLDVKTFLKRPRRHYSGVCYASFFYAAKTGVKDTISQDIEKWLQQVESYVAKNIELAIPRIINMERITDDDRYSISVLLSMLWLRSPNMRVQLNQMEETMVQQLFALDSEHHIDKYLRDTGTIWTKKERQGVVDMIKNKQYRLEFGNAQHLKFLVDSLGLGREGFANLFYAKKWQIYISKGASRFITSDSPVIEWFAPPTGFYGRDFLSRNHYLALTPEIFIELTYPIGSEKIRRKTLFKKDDDMVMMFNHLIASHANEHAYSGDDEIISRMLEARKRPGVAEREYVERYERPWRDSKRRFEKSSNSRDA